MTRRADRKLETHDRIVHTAAGAIRRHGYDGLGVADLMKLAGLTHGGFYAHFESKDALLADAVERAGEETLAGLAAVADAAPAGQGFAQLVDAYLNEAHVAAPDRGCPIAALAGETPRQDPRVQAALAHRTEAFVGLLERHLPRSRDSRQRALAIAACLVGTLTLARAAGDGRHARELLEAARRQAMAMSAA